MPSDEELRKVAEDVRALARSLARDVWEAAQSGDRGGRSATHAFKHGLRDAARDARREFQRGMRHNWHGWGPPPSQRSRWGGPPGYVGAPPGPGPGGSGAGVAGDRAGQPAPPGPPGWMCAPPLVGPRHRRAQRDGRGPLPPVRRRWDASILTALLVVVFGTAWLVGGLAGAKLSTEAVLAAGLMLLGAALVVTARTDWSLSRHAWPVILGGVLIVGLFATSSSFGVGTALSNISIGTMTRNPPATGGTVHGGIGQLTVNATNLQPGSTLTVESIAGETFINAPSDAYIDGKVLAGQICMPKRPASSGVGATLNGGNPGGPTIHIHQLAGEVAINEHGCGHS